MSISEKKNTKMKNVLIAESKPEISDYYEIEKMYGLQIDWRAFMHTEPVDVKDFRKNRIRPDNFSSIIFTEKNSIDHFFRLCDEMSIEMPKYAKYFCLSQVIEHHLQKYFKQRFILYPRRNVFVGEGIMDLSSTLKKYKVNQKFLLPCSNLGRSQGVSAFLDENEFDWKSALMYRTVSSDLSDLEYDFYDFLLINSPLKIKSLFENFPDFEQNDIKLALWGKNTKIAALNKNLRIDIFGPTPDIHWMSKALTNYLDSHHKP